MLHRALPLALALAGAAPCVLAATFTVTTTADIPDTSPGDGVCVTAAGDCSLRAAIEEANATAASDTIAFNVPGPGVHTFQTATLPAATQPVVIDGFTQPGAQPNTNATGGLNAVLTIELAGGLRLVGTARGLVVNGAPLELGAAGAGGNAVEGCFIGTDPTGTQSRSSLDGIRIQYAGATRVGGSLAAQRNLVSGNASGIHISCPAGIGACSGWTAIQHNLIGTAVSGTTALPNAIGVDVLSPGQVSIDANVISGNAGAGVFYRGHTDTGPVSVYANRIGVDHSGAVPVPNQLGIVVEFHCVGPGCVWVGPPSIDMGYNAFNGNVISHNRSHGLSLRSAGCSAAFNTFASNGGRGILIETTARSMYGEIKDSTITGNLGHGIEVNAPVLGSHLKLFRNAIRANALDGVVMTGTVWAGLTANAIEDNGGLGIDNGGDGVTANDFLDLDTGPNDLMNFPVILRTCAVGGVVTVEGTVHTSPFFGLSVEVFHSPSCDPSGHGEGGRYGGGQLVQPDPAGNASFSVSFAGTAGGFVTATAGIPTYVALATTSEFSQCVPVVSTPPPAQSISGPSSVCAGSPVVLRAAPGASAYQWYRDGIAIGGAVEVAYRVRAAAPGDAGTYTVRGSWCGQDATSPPMTLSVVGCDAFPLGLDVDRNAAAGTASDLNGILEPGETVLIEPRYRVDAASALTLTATAALSGPAGGAYSLPDASASYGTVQPGQVTDCRGATGDCYVATVTASPRPATHWDATMVETTSASDPPRQWPLHVGATFVDMPPTNPFYRFVEALVHNGVTAGCSPLWFCPPQQTTRQQMAVFVLAAQEGPAYAPPPCDPSSPRFADVPASSPFCRWIEELARRGVVGGCTATNYCPTSPVSREQMAVFVLATREGPGYAPPACVSGSERFADVPVNSAFCPWIEELARRGVVAGCGGGNYCPTTPVTREQMSVFLTVTFGLLLYGP